MAYYYYTWTRKADYDLNFVKSGAAYKLCDKPYDEIHTTIPRKSDVVPDQAWTYPHITFIDQYGSQHLYIGWDTHGKHIPVNTVGARIMLSSGEWLLFQHIVSDMTEIYSYI